MIEIERQRLQVVVNTNSKIRQNILAGARQDVAIDELEQRLDREQREQREQDRSDADVASCEKTAGELPTKPGHGKGSCRLEQHEQARECEADAVGSRVTEQSS